MYLQGLTEAEGCAHSMPLIWDGNHKPAVHCQLRQAQCGYEYGNGPISDCKDLAGQFRHCFLQSCLHEAACQAVM